MITSNALASALAILLLPHAPKTSNGAGRPAWEIVEGTGGYMSASAVDGSFLCLAWAGQSVVLACPDGSSRLIAAVGVDGVTGFSEPCSFRSVGSFSIDSPFRDSVCTVDASGAIASGMSGSVAGRPAWSEDGRLFCTLDGRLFVDGEPTQVETGSFLAIPSPGGTMAAWPEGEGIVIASVRDGRQEIRSLPAAALCPVWIDGSTLLVPLVDGTIHLLRIPGSGSTPFAAGEGLAWNFGMSTGLVTVTRDDGHFLTGSRSFLADRIGRLHPVDAPEGTAPVSPMPAPWGFTAVDGMTGTVMALRLDH